MRLWGGKGTSALRYFVYVSDLKVQMFLDQISQPARRSIAAELKLDLKLVSLTLSSPAIDGSLRQRSLLAKLAVVENYINHHHQVGDLAAARGYVLAEAKMDWKPLDDDETVIFCGYAGPLTVVLGGSVNHLTGRPPSAMQIGSHPSTIRAAVFDGNQFSSGDLGSDLEASVRAVYSTPQPVRFLARVISRGPLNAESPQNEYLLATPLYVEAIDAIDAGGER